MRLLSRKIVNATVATQRKESIDQGIKIAKKIDDVRTMLSQEERALQEFRSSSIQNVTKEIDALLRTKDAMISEIQSLEETRLKARIPLDAEWREVHERRAEIEMQCERLTIRENNAHTIEGLLQTERKAVAQELQRAQEKTRLSTIALQEIETKDKEKDILLAEAHNLKAQAEHNFITKESNLAMRESGIENTEKILERRRLEADKRDLAFNDRERQLKDREDTLARNIQRHG